MVIEVGIRVNPDLSVVTSYTGHTSLNFDCSVSHNVKKQKIANPEAFCLVLFLLQAFFKKYKMECVKKKGWGCDPCFVTIAAKESASSPNV
jgi:hypothetical protein